MLRVLIYDPDTGSTVEKASVQALELLDHDQTSAWVDLVKPTEDEIAALQRKFNLHPLAVKATRSSLKYPTPRTEIYDGVAYIRWFCVTPRALGVEKLDFSAINIFVDRRYFITIRRESIGIVDDLYKAVSSGDFLKDGSASLLHRMLDSIVDEFFPLLDGISDEVDILEDGMMRRPSDGQLHKLFEYKHQLLSIHKIIAPERETINVLTRFELGIITPEIQPYFLDIYDHLVQLSDIVDTSRDVIGGAMDIYLSSISNRLNEVMKKLMVVATIFLPLTLVTGIFGMNLPFVVDNVKGFLVAMIAAVCFIVAVIIANRKK